MHVLLRKRKNTTTFSVKHVPQKAEIQGEFDPLLPLQNISNSTDIPHDEMELPILPWPQYYFHVALIKYDPECTNYQGKL